MWLACTINIHVYSVHTYNTWPDSIWRSVRKDLHQRIKFCWYFIYGPSNSQLSRQGISKEHLMRLTVIMLYRCVRLFNNWSKAINGSLSCKWIFVKYVFIKMFSIGWGSQHAYVNSHVPNGYTRWLVAHTASPTEVSSMHLIYPLLHSEKWMYKEAWKPVLISDLWEQYTSSLMWVF